MRYEGNIYRPPNEWRSYLLQVTIGCSHNACTFCGMFKDKKYRVRSMTEILEDIRTAGYLMPETERVFLCDGDAIAVPTEDLLTILAELKKAFPNCTKIATYAGPRSTLRKSPEELLALREAGLTRAYLGVESGDEKVLRDIHKGVSAEEMCRAGQLLVQAGLDVYTFIIVGLAGKSGSAAHAAASADIINRIQPQHLAAMTYMPTPGTPMFRDVQSGKFELMSDEECLLETRALMQGIDLPKIHFSSIHASNYVPIQGTLPDDRERLTAVIDEALSGRGEKRPEVLRGL